MPSPPPRTWLQHSGRPWAGLARLHPYCLTTAGASTAAAARRACPGGAWKPTAFEAGLLEWLHGSMGREIRHHESLAAYVKYYNERRLHFGLDIANRRMPIMRSRTRRPRTRSGSLTPDGWRETSMNSGHYFHITQIRCFCPFFCLRIMTGRGALQIDHWI